MARNFNTVFSNIITIAPEELAAKLKENIKFCAPEARWSVLSETVNNYVAPSSTNAQSLAIYAELCDISMAEMKAELEIIGR